ncbi:hypothetical protein [Nocardia sp. NBC_01009]|uniref:hypothetical protein n=1 Tax=Nocardia sp. NBC_01009 TaxID=2975996 RepID=UPI003865746C|nr:hypothetical protein OHA42_15975 [Nocardia sp. NBC_01009]
MNTARSLFVLSATPVAAVALLATAAPATAEGKFATMYSLTQGACFAQVDSSVNGDAYPSSAAFTVSTTMFGIGPCTLPVTLNWRNLASGATGSFTVTANGPGYWSNSSYSAIFQPGIGDFTSTVTIGAAHLPEPGNREFTVHEYQP